MNFNRMGKPQDMDEIYSSASQTQWGLHPRVPSEEVTVRRRAAIGFRKSERSCETLNGLDLATSLLSTYILIQPSRTILATRQCPTVAASLLWR